MSLTKIILFACGLLLVCGIVWPAAIFAQTNLPIAPPPPKIDGVKITSTHKGQQVPVGNDLIISGTPADNAFSNCKVSVKVNFINPYHAASANGPGGQTDYSRWSFTLT